jgi:cell shape-determining protein MreD
MRNSDGFIVAFLAGLLLDVFLLRPLGESSVYFLIVLFLIFMYEKKYEVNSLLFMTLATGVTSCIYFVIFPVPGSLSQVITATLLGGFLYILLHIKKTKKQASISHL